MSGVLGAWGTVLTGDHYTHETHVTDRTQGVWYVGGATPVTVLTKCYSHVMLES